MSGTNQNINWKEKAQTDFMAYHDAGRTWLQVEADINKAIKEIPTQTSEKLSSIINIRVYTDTWKDRIIDKIGSRMSPEMWQDLYKVYLWITTRSTSLTTSSPAKASIINTSFIYYTTKFQDTVLPYIYRSSYTPILKKIKFDINRDWGEVVEAFKKNTVQVALHNFPTALAITRNAGQQTDMFFFPFFLFTGYGIVIKKSSIEKFCSSKGITNTGFSRLKENKGKFLEWATTILEPNTDVEWVFKKFCLTHDADWATVKKNIKAFDINEGKQKFLRTGDIYCTNPIHLIDLGKQNDKYEILKNDEVTGHRNMNGLICKMDFFDNNTDVVRRLIDVWYHNINEFLADKEAILHGCQIGHFDFTEVKRLNVALNDFTKSKLTLPELMASYRDNNIFFTRPEEAFQGFYTVDFVEKQNNDKSSFEIADLQSAGQGSIIPDRTILEKLYTNMTNAFQKLNFR